MSEKALSTDERHGAERCWIWRNAFHEPCISSTRPDPKVHPSVEYMRVLSRQEVEKLASGEGIDTQQYINSLLRTIEGQRKQIASMQRRVEECRSDA